MIEKLWSTGSLHACLVGASSLGCRSRWCRRRTETIQGPQLAFAAYCLARRGGMPGASTEAA
jgi:hypothetical protein